MEKIQEEIIQEIIELVVELGWNIIIPQDKDECDGLIIGNDDFLKELNLDVEGETLETELH